VNTKVFFKEKVKFMGHNSFKGNWTGLPFKYARLHNVNFFAPSFIKIPKGCRRSCEGKSIFQKTLSPWAITPLRIIGQGPPYNMHTSTVRPYLVSSFIRIPKWFRKSCEDEAYFKENASPGIVTPLRIIGHGCPYNMLIYIM
jgi:hypothetical protein